MIAYSHDYGPSQDRISMSFGRGPLGGRTSSEIVAFVHARLTSKEARARFEAARFQLSLPELIELAEATLRTAFHEATERATRSRGSLHA